MCSRRRLLAAVGTRAGLARDRPVTRVSPGRPPGCRGMSGAASRRHDRDVTCSYKLVQLGRDGRLRPLLWPGAASLTAVLDIDVAADGSLVVLDAAEGGFASVWRLAPGVPAVRMGPEIETGEPRAIAAAADGSVLVVDAALGTVTRIAAEGSSSTAAAGLSRPSALDALPDGSFVVADTGNGARAPDRADGSATHDRRRWARLARGCRGDRGPARSGPRAASGGGRHAGDRRRTPAHPGRSRRHGAHDRPYRRTAGCSADHRSATQHRRPPGRGRDARRGDRGRNPARRQRGRRRGRASGAGERGHRAARGRRVAPDARVARARPRGDRGEPRRDGPAAADPRRSRGGFAQRSAGTRRQPHQDAEHPRAPNRICCRSRLATRAAAWPVIGSA